MALRIVNGIAFDCTNLWVVIGRTTIPLNKISYGDKLDKGTLTMLGSQQIDAVTGGSYSTEDPKLSIDEVKYRQFITPLLAQNGFGNVASQVIVGWEHPDLGTDTDAIDIAGIVGTTHSPANDNKAAEVEWTLKATQVYYGNERKTINKVYGGGTTSNSRL